MCGITFIFNKSSCIYPYVISHRGPDDHVRVSSKYGILLFDRLSINDIDGGKQPFELNDSYFMCNGEIYNHEELKQQFSIHTVTKSDCEVVHGMLASSSTIPYETTFSSIDGVFACVYTNRDDVIVARDPIGVRPLFMAICNNTGDVMGFCSEAKGLNVELSNVTIRQFPPGCYWSMNTNTICSYKALSLPLMITDNNTNNNVPNYDMYMIRQLLTDAVRKRFMTDRSMGFFLSGGLDSSIVAAIGASISSKPIVTYSIGIKGGNSPDLNAAKIVAEHLGARHIVFEFDPMIASNCVEHVIYHLESYDCTTVRASVPMFLLSRYISIHTNDVVIMSGEGADELFGGYLYFHHAPNTQEFHQETIRLLTDVHQYDVLRADRCTAAHGLELRVPFFDKKLVEYVTNMDPSKKLPVNGIEKHILRQAFSDLLPTEIINRQKNGMSDAVGYSWVDHLKEIASSQIQQMNSKVFNDNKPLTDEEQWYRLLHDKLFNINDNTVISNTGVWRPKWTNVTDPSARQLDVFTS